MSSSQPPKKSLDFSNTADLLKIEKELITLENWEDAKLDFGNIGGHSGYHIGQQQIMNILVKLLKESRNDVTKQFDINKQLEGLIDERQKFLKHAFKNMD